MDKTIFGSESYRVKGERLVGKIRELIREGNVRRIIIKNDEGRTLIEAPLTIGVVGALVAPVWAAIGAIAALVADCSIEVERDPMHQHEQAHPEDSRGAGDGPAEPLSDAERERYRRPDEQC